MKVSEPIVAVIVFTIFAVIGALWVSGAFALGGSWS